MSFLPFKSRQRKTKNSFLFDVFFFLSFFFLYFCLFSKSYLKWMLRACWVVWLLLLCFLRLWLWLWTRSETVGKGRLVGSLPVWMSWLKMANEYERNGTERVRHIWSIREASCPLTELNSTRRPSFFSLKSFPPQLVALWQWIVLFIYFFGHLVNLKMCVQGGRFFCWGMGVSLSFNTFMTGDVGVKLPYMYVQIIFAYL